MSRTLVSALTATVALAALAAGPVFAADKAAPEKGPYDKAQIEQIVHDYILAHPEVISEAAQALQDKADAEEAKASAEALVKHKDDLVASKASPVGGNVKGDVTMVEFFDYQCGYCKHTQPELDAAVKKDGKVRIVYKEFPILGPASVVAAKAALAANMQGKYDTVHAALMAATGKLDRDRILAIAKDAGADTDRLAKDMDSPAVQKEIDANLELADALNIHGTPGFVIGATVVPGAIGADAFKDLFAKARSAKG
ncbi:MAG: DsbA family protein [Azospirillaceae bacterium]|nr:DsbA family protein [Azospirillaceae bacterium]